MARTYRVAVIGRTGHGDYGHGIDVAWKHIPRCEIVAVADDDPAGRKKAEERLGLSKGYADYREMLDKEKPEIVAIALRWIDQHPAMALAAAERGIHMYMEKPFCGSLEEADAVLRVCEMTHAKLALAHLTRYSPVFEKVRGLVAEGAIGDVLELNGRGKEDARGGGEDLWVLGSHILNMMTTLAGPATACTALVSDQGRPVTREDLKPGNEGIPVLAGDRVHASFAFADGVVGTFDSVRGAGGQPSRFGLLIKGSKGQIEIGTGYLPYAMILRDVSWSPGRTGAAWESISSAGIGKPEPVSDPDGHAGNVAAASDLIDAIESQRAPLCDGKAGRQVVEMIRAVFESQVTGQTIPLGSA